MNREMTKISSITKELINYFLMHDAKDIELKIKVKEDKTEINIHSENIEFTEEDMENIKSLLNVGREIENDEYYCQVIGVNSEGEELSAIGVMVDEAKIKWNKPSLDISLIRKR
ncbi:MAG TPA: hypothetical protein GXX53_06620 [Tissierellia bacterium]|nr:hypothetical protein [Tissierellia bacterium]